MTWTLSFFIITIKTRSEGGGGVKCVDGIVVVVVRWIIKSVSFSSKMDEGDNGLSPVDLDVRFDKIISSGQCSVQKGISRDLDRQWMLTGHRTT